VTSKQLLQLFGLKWNPFLPDVPPEALCRTPRLESFIWRVEQLCRDGGFAAVVGDPGLGKSVTLRLTADHLGGLRDVVVGELTRPQARTADFYRELGHLFHVPLVPHNRWAGANALRDVWHAHIEAANYRPILLIDESQEVLPQVLSELRLLASANLDSKHILTVIFAGDSTFLEKLREPALLPLASRLRVRLLLEPASPEELVACLRHVLEKAGNPKLMTPELIQTLAEHAAGNYRALMSMANDLLLAGAKLEVKNLDEALFFQVFSSAVAQAKPARVRGRNR
jgi:type II secretory pathway predicted ATPase ExeA